MIELLSEIEAIPAAYPAIDPRWVVERGDEDEDPGSDLIWQRIEAYTRTRYTDRQVMWILEGDALDVWIPPLSPVTSMTVEHWDDNVWTLSAFSSAPLGYTLPSDGHFRVTAQVGNGDVPAAVQEAFKRLHEYSRGIAEQFKGDASAIQDNGTELVRAWTAKALQLSGAGDVLRPYRRLK